MYVVKKLCDSGVIPLEYDFKQTKERGGQWSVAESQPLFMGQCVGLTDKVMSAKEIVDELVRDAIATIQRNQRTIIYAKL